MLSTNIKLQAETSLNWFDNKNIRIPTKLIKINNSKKYLRKKRILSFSLLTIEYKIIKKSIEPNSFKFKFCP